MKTTIGESGMSKAREVDRARLLAFCLYGLGAVVLITMALPRATWRHFHVDEFNNAFEMQLMVRHPDLARCFEPLLLLLGWLCAPLKATGDILLCARLAVFALFGAALLLTARIQNAFPTATGRGAVFVAVSLCLPLWRHGMELRHDIVILLGMLVLFGLAQRAVREPLPRGGALLAGVVAIAMQASAHKAFVFWGPALGVVAWAQIGNHGSRGFTRTACRMILGALAASALWAAVLASAGRLASYLQFARSFLRVAPGATRFSAVPVFAQMVADAPLVSSMAIVFCGVAAYRAWLARSLRPSDALVTVAFLSLACATLLVNPTPFPYNALTVIPFVFLAAVYGVAAIMERMPGRHLLVAVLSIYSVFAFAKAIADDPFINARNTSQLQVIDAVELLTDQEDPVLDGAGIVLTRPPPSPDWLLHSLAMSDYLRGQREQFHTMIERVAPPVALVNYRWRWLSQEDNEAFAKAFTKITDVLWVLGGEVGGTSGAFEVRRSGRYALEPVGGGAAGLEVDGVRADRVVQLAKGTHAYRMERGEGLRFVWVGPRLERPVRLPPTPAFFPFRPDLY